MQGQGESPVPPLETRLTSHHAAWGRHTLQRYFICIFTLKFVTQFISALVEIPTVSLFEAAICREYYHQHPHARNPDVRESPSNCKIAPIQNKVALVMGLKVTFDAIPGLLISLWYGSLANRRGRRIVLGLASLGGFLSWSWVCLICLSEHGPRIEYVWLSSIFYFIGGGNRLLLGIIFATCVDVVPWDQRIYRSQVLFYLHAMTHISRMVAPPLATALMQNEIRYPFELALILMLFRLILVAALPETRALAFKSIETPAHQERTPLQPHEESISEALSPPTLQGVRNMTGHTGMAIMFAAFVVKRAAFSSENLTFQYASEKMRKQLYQTAVLRVANTVGAIVVLSAALPLLSRYGPWASPRKDVIFMRVSLKVAVLGFTTLFFGSNFTTMCIGMAVAGLAEGLEPSLQSLGSYIVGESLNAHYFALVSMLDLVGEIIGGPSMAAAYSIRDAGGSPAGYPFLLSAALFATLFAASYFMRVEKLQSLSPSIQEHSIEREALLRDDELSE